MAPETDFVGSPKTRPKPNAGPRKGAKRAMPATAAAIGSKKDKPAEPMAIARLMKTLAPMVAGGGR